MKKKLMIMVGTLLTLVSLFLFVGTYQIEANTTDTTVVVSSDHVNHIATSNQGAQNSVVTPDDTQLNVVKGIITVVVAGGVYFFIPKTIKGF
ncbi:hypothetical protein FC40_GL001346 [Ligilactobacillus hayakitensis DSM 18933 = JCM 14209]|uniref:Uncharacterized protein n=1 Tax=Ligilactobacillus hayakitensis DSM 18933 = JCM 14209 TaxID=1423755 RepID=A0A0R1WPR5_9LACO|nr:hypothetical protein [Ligilactobacillus hayakitensis]KRM19742.1 hypothetical protein FC40_GL001346 [Ligilactobacillus hayakitensis DSM 18933 = JCM 14209]